MHHLFTKGQNYNWPKLTFPKQALFFTCLQYKSFDNTKGKGEITRNEQFLLFPTVFSTHSVNFLPFFSNLKLSSANSFSLEESKICRLGERVNQLSKASRDWRFPVARRQRTWRENKDSQVWIPKLGQGELSIWKPLHPLYRSIPLRQ